MQTDYPRTIAHKYCSICQQPKKYGHLTCDICFIHNELHKMTDEQDAFFQRFEKKLEGKENAQMTLGELVAIAKQRGNTREFANL